MKGKINSLSGITLIALVVTIVILIILATISVNIVINGGLIDRTSKGKELHELERERERLELIKGEVASDTNHVGKVTVDTYVEELINQGITVTEEVTDEEDGSKTVITDTGYSVLIKPRGDKDVEIIIEGKAGQLPPRIVNIDLTRDNDAKTIKVDITVKRAEGATYSYYYKIDNEDWVEIEKNTDKTSVTISDIDPDKTYIIKVDATNEYGTTSSSKNSEPGPITADKLQNGQYVWYIDSEGNKRKSFVLYTASERNNVEIATIEKVGDLTLGFPNDGTSATYSEVGKQFNNMESLFNETPRNLVNSELALGGRALFTGPNGVVQSFGSTGLDAAVASNTCLDRIKLTNIGMIDKYSDVTFLTGMKQSKSASVNGQTVDYKSVVVYRQGNKYGTDCLGKYGHKNPSYAASYKTSEFTYPVFGTFQLRNDVMLGEGSGTEDDPYTIIANYQ